VVSDRKESIAEHCWSSFLLADYFLQKEELSLDRQKIYDMIIYHDIVELEIGDIPIHHNDHGLTKKLLEDNARPHVLNQLPSCLFAKVKQLLDELEESKAPEANFIHAVEKLDPLIQCLYDRELFIQHNYTVELIRKKKDHYMTQFPPINEMYTALLEYLVREGYIT